jgi:hypothetical protein
MDPAEHPEITAMRTAYLALSPLDAVELRRAMRWLISKIDTEEAADRAAAELSRLR